MSIPGCVDELGFAKFKRGDCEWGFAKQREFERVGHVMERQAARRYPRG